MRHFAGHVPQRTQEQIDSDREFLSQSRSRSPKYPDAGEALARLQRQRETIAARVLLGGAAIFAVCALLAADWRFHALASGLCFTGFVITCLVSGNRSWKRSGSPRC